MNRNPLVGSWAVQEVTSQAGPGVPWFDRIEIRSASVTCESAGTDLRTDRYHLEEGRDAAGDPVILLVREGQLPWVVRQTRDGLWLIEDVVGGYSYRLSRVVTSRG